MVGVWDSTTLEKVSDLRPPTMPVKTTPTSLVFSPDGRLFACIYIPILEPNRLVLPPISLTLLIYLYRLSITTPPHIVVWDIQTGMVINQVATTWNRGKIIFSWDQSTITLVTRSSFHTYDRLSGEWVHEGELPLSQNYQWGAHWVYEESLLYAMSSKSNGKLMISIQELQPTSDHLFHVVNSFPGLPQDGIFSFSQVSFHASFVSGGEIVILDVRDSKVLFQSKGARSYYVGTGSFSHDGRLCACGISGGEIHIWEHISTGYVLQSSHRPRFSWDSFSWSPTSISILCWGSHIIHLLHPDDHLSLTSPNMVEHVQYTDHLVTYSADKSYIIIGQCGKGLITVLDHSGITQQSINTNAEILDIKFVNDSLFVMDRNRLSTWHLGTGAQVNSVYGMKRESTALCVYVGRPLVLSSNCSQIAFAIGKAAFLYDVVAQKVLGDIVTDGDDIIHIQFSPDESQLWLIVDLPNSENYKCYRVELDRAKDPCFGNVTIEDLGDEWSLDSLFRSADEYRMVGTRSKWVSGPRGNVLWLPVNWRRTHGLGTRWGSHFLAFLSGYHPEPIIIEFQS